MRAAISVRKTAVFWVSNGLAVLLSISGIAPLVWMLYSSVKTNAEFIRDPIALPVAFQLRNYVDAFQTGRMGAYFFNSVINTSLSVTATVILGFTVAYYLARMKFPGRNVLYVFFVSGMIIPIYALLVPIFIQFTWLGLTDGRFTLIAPYIAFALPTTVFLTEGFLRSVPVEVEEVACIDGASLNTTLFRVVLPMCRPIIATVTVLSFISSWNEFPLALVLISSRRFLTLPVGLTHFFGEFSAQYTQLFAALVIVSAPAILVYLVFQKRVITGMTAGAVKG